MPTSRSSIHYGWFIVPTGTLCIFAALGVGRFSLGMLLPATGQGLGLTVSQMGFLGTANFVGYLVSALLCGHVAARIGTRRLIVMSLLLVGTTMILVGRSGQFIPVMILYTLTGMGSAAANIPMMSLVPAWFARSHRGRAAGFIVIGSGFAILMAGKLVPFINRMYETDGWRMNWQILGVLVIGIAFVCLAVLRNRPSEKGLHPVGFDEDSGKKTAALNATAQLAKGRADSRTLLHLGIIYFLFGYTYVIYVTFFVTTLVKDLGFTEKAAGGLWSWVGVLSLLSGPVPGLVADRLGRKAALMIVFGLQTVSYLLIGLELPGIFLYLSVIFFGCVAWSIPSIMAVLVGDLVGADRTARAFGFVTFIFGLGQILGPAVAGWMAERTGNFSSAFLMASVLAALAVGISAALRTSPRQ